jgi:hypothetical protein
VGVRASMPVNSTFALDGEIGLIRHLKSPDSIVFRNHHTSNWDSSTTMVSQTKSLFGIHLDSGITVRLHDTLDMHAGYRTDRRRSSVAHTGTLSVRDKF